MPKAARVGDLHTCPMGTHTGGPVSRGASTIMIGGAYAARIGDVATCDGPTDAIARGEPTVLIENMPAARQGDATAHGGVITGGEATVLIGMTAQAVVLARAAQRGSPFCEECERAREE